jgi:hypothetical protein
MKIWCGARVALFMILGTGSISGFLFAQQPPNTLSLSNLNNRCFADAQQPLTNDAGQKIAACIAALPLSGGFVDATGFQGAQVISSAIVFDRPVQLLLGGAKFSYAGTAANVPLGLIQFTNAGRGSSIIGINRDSLYGDSIYDPPYQPSAP